MLIFQFPFLLKEMSQQNELESTAGGLNIFLISFPSPALSLCREMPSAQPYLDNSP